MDVDLSGHYTHVDARNHECHKCEKLVKGTTTNNIHKHVANCLGLDIYKIYCNYCDFCHVVRSTTDEHQLKTHIPDNKRTACCKDCGIAWYQGEGRLERHHPRICPAPGRGKVPRVKNLAGRNWNPEEWKFEYLPNVTVSLATPFDTGPERQMPEDNFPRPKEKKKKKDKTSQNTNPVLLDLLRLRSPARIHVKPRFEVVQAHVELRIRVFPLQIESKFKVAHPRIDSGVKVVHLHIDPRFRVDTKANLQLARRPLLLPALAPLL
ncbi:hypothetical protein JCM5353_008734 [Sporobolomyces roseus]